MKKPYRTPELHRLRRPPQAVDPCTCGRGLKCPLWAKMLVTAIEVEGEIAAGRRRRGST